MMMMMNEDDEHNVSSTRLDDGIIGDAHDTKRPSPPGTIPDVGDVEHVAASGKHDCRKSPITVDHAKRRKTFTPLISGEAAGVVARMPSQHFPNMRQSLLRSLVPSTISLLRCCSGGRRESPGNHTNMDRQDKQSQEVDADSNVSAAPSNEMQPPAVATAASLPASVVVGVPDVSHAVCLRWIHHPPTQLYRTVVARFAEDRVTYPRWNHGILDQIKAALRHDHNMDQFLVFRDNDNSQGQPIRRRRMFHRDMMNLHGTWQPATDEEVLQWTRQMFADQRKMVRRRSQPRDTTLWRRRTRAGRPPPERPITLQPTAPTMGMVDPLDAMAATVTATNNHYHNGGADEGWLMPDDVAIVDHNPFERMVFAADDWNAGHGEMDVDNIHQEVMVEDARMEAPTVVGLKDPPMAKPTTTTAGTVDRITPREKELPIARNDDASLFPSPPPDDDEIELEALRREFFYYDTHYRKMMSAVHATTNARVWMPCEIDTVKQARDIYEKALYQRQRVMLGTLQV